MQNEFWVTGSCFERLKRWSNGWNLRFIEDSLCYAKRSQIIARFTLKVKSITKIVNS